MRNVSDDIELTVKPPLRMESCEGVAALEAIRADTSLFVGKVAAFASTSNYRQKCILLSMGEGLRKNTVYPATAVGYFRVA